MHGSAGGIDAIVGGAAVVVDIAIITIHALAAGALVSVRIAYLIGSAIVGADVAVLQLSAGGAGLHECAHVIGTAVW